MYFCNRLQIIKSLQIQFNTGYCVDTTLAHEVGPFFIVE